MDGLTGNPEVEYIPGPGFVDDVIASRHDLNHNGSFEDSEIFYHLTDQQYSTIALLDSGGHLVERYDYDPFGVPSIYAPDGTPRSQSA